MIHAAGRAAAVLALLLVPASFTVPGASLRAQEAAAPAGDTVTEADSARLVGRVVSALTGEPIQGAAVGLRRARHGAITDSSGNFALPRGPAGQDTVEVRYVGYESGHASIYLAPERTSRVVLLLSPTAVRLAELEVEVPRGRAVSAVMAGFERRKARGMGYFFTREDVERYEPRYTTELLRRVPGLRVGAGRSMGRSRITIGRDGLYCSPVVFVDGLHLEGASVDDVIVNDLGGIEVYTGPGEVPAEFAAMAPSACGAILIWTRRGERPEDRRP